MRVNAIIVAGGSGRRLGSAVPKQFLEVGGLSMIARVANAFARLEGLTRVVIVAQPEHWARCQELLAGILPVEIALAPAGEERQDSVAAGLDGLEEECEVVIVHDAARPFVTAGLVDRCVAAAFEAGAALAALPASDTVKEVASARRVVRTLRRQDIWLAQTPQAFRASLLKQAHAAASLAGLRATDDAALVERLGAEVVVVQGEATNIKITTPADLALAEKIARARFETRS